MTAPEEQDNGLPLIRFNSPWELFYKIISRSFPDEIKSIDLDEFERTETDVISEWSKYQPRVLRGICSITRLSYRKNIIDITLAPNTLNVSRPLIIGIGSDQDSFVDTVTFQLIFEILTDNTILPIGYDVVEDWIELFSSGSNEDVAYFVPSYAVQKAICLDILNDQSRLDAIMDRTHGIMQKDQYLAWEYVNKNDYREIINSLCTLYKNIADGFF